MSGAAVNWLLYYKQEAGVPREFCELRRLGASVSVRTGQVQTWGRCEATEYGSEEEAAAELLRIAATRAEGFVLAREWIYDPEHFDFKLLQNEIREGARQAFTALRAAHPGKTLIGYALVTDDSAMTLGPVANSEEAQAESGEPEDVFFNPGEWAHYEGGELLDIAYRLLLPRQQGVPSEIPFEDFRDGVFEAGVLALEELDREGFFGAGPVRERTLVLFAPSDGEPPAGSIGRLNPPALARRCQEWYGE